MNLGHAIDHHPIQAGLVVPDGANESDEDPLQPGEPAADNDFRVDMPEHVVQVSLVVLQVFRPEALFHELGADLPVQVSSHRLEQLRVKSVHYHGDLSEKEYGTKRRDLGSQTRLTGPPRVVTASRS